jgi:hypothetical protein
METTLVSQTKQKEVRNPVLIPEKTKSYTPVPNGEFIDAVLEEADKRDFSLHHEEWKLVRKGMIMHGFLTFDGEDPDMGMQVGLLNSYNKEYPATIAIGSTVFICSNGMISADYSLRRRHTTNVWDDLNKLITTALNGLVEEHYKTINVKSTLSQIEFPKRKQAELFGRMLVETDIFSPSMINVVRNEIIDSTFESFKEDTAWSFYNHGTYALRKAHIVETDRRHIQFHELMKDLFIN